MRHGDDVDNRVGESARMARTLVIGLDGFDWELASRWLPELPAIAGLAARGAFGPLESVVPPVTPPAWTGMATGRNPGHFGFTDFTVRRPGTYAGRQLVHSGLVRADSVFDLADRGGRRTFALSVPVSYPPRPRRHGAVLSCLMTPSLAQRVVLPPGLKDAWIDRAGDPLLFDATIADSDVAGNPDALLRKLRRLDDQRFDLATLIAKEDNWDLLFLVATGTDRVAHYFMNHLDERHVAYPAEPRYANAIRDHYRHCDVRIAELLDLVSSDTTVLVVSDHGVQRLDSKLSLNDWLARKGFLKLEHSLRAACSLANAPVDWDSTRAWASGFGGQIFINRSGRYPRGWLDEQDAEAVIEELVGELAGLRDGDRPISAEVFRGEDVFTGPYAADCPDLCLALDGLHMLTRDGVGLPRLVEPPGGPSPEADMASHAGSGFLAIAGPGIPAVGRCAGLSIYDVAPTILELLELDGAAQLDGRSLLGDLSEAYTSEEEAELTSRLSALYLD